jgi:hypothetical protein
MRDPRRLGQILRRRFNCRLFAPPSAVIGLVALVVLPLIATVASAGPTRTVAGDDLLDSPLPDKTFVSSERDVTITWQVRTRDGNIRFRLYRGPNSQSLDLVTEEPATPGVQRYEYKDVLDLFGPVWYELRFVTPSGNEVSLASMLYLIPNMEPSPDKVAWPSTDNATVEAPPQLQGPGSYPRFDVNPPVETGFIPEPARPPPKAKLGPHAMT